MKNSKDIAYFTKFEDAEGHEHYAIHFYNRINGFVTTMQDLKY